MTRKYKIIVFDLDDTLFKEIDYLKSGYHHIASLVSNVYIAEDGVYQLMLNTYLQGGDSFATVVQKYGFRSFSVEWMQGVYRNHKPKISLDDDTKDMLDRLKTNGVKLGVITDGRTRQQQNKMDALELSKYMDKNDIVINVKADRFKPDRRSFRHFMNKYGEFCDYWYVGDNTDKDFLAPNSLGWTTVCLLDDGMNIHKQCFDKDPIYLPKYKISRIGEILGLI